MTGKDNDNVLFRPGLLARILLGIVFTAITGTAVWFVADKYLPSDKVYSQKFKYSCEGDYILSWQKRHYLELKFIQFKNIAHSRFPTIALRLKADYDVAANTLRVYAVFPDVKPGSVDNGVELDYSAKFNSFIELCHLSEVDPSSQLFDPGGSDYKIKAWIKKNTQKLSELEYEYAQLQIKLSEHEQKILEMMVAPADSGQADKSKDNSGVGQKTTLTKKIDDLREKLKQLNQEQKELDFKAANCNSLSDLEIIDSNKNNVFAKRQNVITEINEIENKLSDNNSMLSYVSLNIDNTDQELAKEKDKCDSVRYEMKLMKNNIILLKDDIAFVSGFIDKPIHKSSSSEENVAEVISEEALNYYGKFQVYKPFADIEEYQTYSFLQLLAISLSLILGWFIGMTTYSKLESVCHVEIPPGSSSGGHFCDSLSLPEDIEPETKEAEEERLGVSDNAQTYTVQTPQPETKKELTDFEPWWVECYDRLAFQLLKVPRQSKSGIIITTLDKSKASPRFAVNLAISLSLKNQKVLLASASGDGMLEKIFTDFDNEYPEHASSSSIENKKQQGQGFWYCLENDKDYYLYSSNTTLENLRFISAGNNSDFNINNEINNNSINAEMLSVSYFDWILVYMPELLNGGVKGFESRIADSPISLLLSQFKDIAVIDYMTGNTKRKEAVFKKLLANNDCRLLDFI